MHAVKNLRECPRFHDLSLNQNAFAPQTDPLECLSDYDKSKSEEWFAKCLEKAGVNEEQAELAWAVRGQSY